MANEKIRWGVLGTGRIAKTVTKALRESSLAQMTAVASRDAARAAAFGEELGLKPFASYEAMLSSNEVDAIYVATPHPMHEIGTVEALRAGKPVLCEKPLGIACGEVERMIAAARKHDLFLMEGFMYRCHPMMARLEETVAAKTLGEVRLIHVTFGFNVPVDPVHRFFSPDLAGGGILDLGTYPVSISRRIAGAAAGQPFRNPVSFAATGVMGDTGVDEYAAAQMIFANDVVSQVACGVRVPLPRHLTIFCTEGRIEVPQPYHPGVFTKGRASFDLVRTTGLDEEKRETVEVANDRPLFATEFDMASRAILDGKRECAAMTWADSLGNAAVLDEWRAAVAAG